jgi:predicted trehalose synthase
MDAKSELENLMPDSLSRWILGLSILLASVLYGVYPDLPKSWKPQIEEQQFLTRLLLSGSALLLGSVTLVILARHDKKVRLQNAELKNALDVVSTDAQGYSKSNKTLQSLFFAANALVLEALKKSHSELERIANDRKVLLEATQKELSSLKTKPIIKKTSTRSYS